jgi:hypothetical protein
MLCPKHLTPLMRFGQEWVCPIEFFFSRAGSSHVTDIVPLDARRLEVVFSNGFSLALEDPHSDDYDTCGPFPGDPDLQLELFDGCTLLDVRYISVSEPWLLFNFSQNVWAIATLQTVQESLEVFSDEPDRDEVE